MVNALIVRNAERASDAKRALSSKMAAAVSASDESSFMRKNPAANTAGMAPKMTTKANFQENASAMILPLMMLKNIEIRRPILTDIRSWRLERSDVSRDTRAPDATRSKKSMRWWRMARK